MRPRRRLERRLFGWLFAVAVVPTILVLAGSLWIGARALELTGSLGPWEQVGTSARALFEALDTLQQPYPPGLVEAAEAHRRQVTESLALARRWNFLGQRLAGALPLVLLGLVLALAGAALLVSRKLARGLTRPIHELVGWAEALAREEPLPPPAPAEARDVREVGVLRAALRRAAAEREEARRRALEAERTRAWGEMARRVAHEMKNPLTPLRLAAHRLTGVAAREPALAEPVSVIDEETRRLEDLAAQFSELGRPPEGPASPVDLAELLRGILDTDVPADVTVRFDAPPAETTVLAYYEPLLRAFRNLIRNAVEAMESASERVLEVELRAGDGAVRARIADRGAGLPPGAGARIFEPDFTTKSRGTGLGLALARQTVRDAGGEIEAAPRAGGGAEFVVRLPAAPRAAS